MSNWQDIQKKLLEPFPADAISWKPAVTTKGRDKKPIERNGQRVAGCVAHIDARNVMNRLDETVGAGEWSDSYRVIDGKHVECTLTVKGVSKTDVGETNEGGVADPMKSAYSDAFKRAAVKFGIGRHLYDMDMEWLPFDGYKILSTPSGNTRQPVSQPAQQPSQDARGATSPQKQAERKRPARKTEPKAKSNGDGASWKEKALKAKSLPEFASAAAFGLDGYKNDHHVMAALEGVEDFEYNAAKNEVYWDWLSERKTEEAA